jgi:hypothetical protein
MEAFLSLLLLYLVLGGAIFLLVRLLDIYYPWEGPSEAEDDALRQTDPPPVRRRTLLQDQGPAIVPWEPSRPGPRPRRHGVRRRKHRDTIDGRIDATVDRTLVTMEGPLVDPPPGLSGRAAPPPG